LNFPIIVGSRAIGIGFLGVLTSERDYYIVGLAKDDAHRCLITALSIKAYSP